MKCPHGVCQEWVDNCDSEKTVELMRKRRNAGTRRGRDVCAVLGRWEILASQAPLPPTTQRVANSGPVFGGVGMADGSPAKAAGYGRMLPEMIGVPEL